MRSEEPHISEETLAVLVDGRLDPAAEKSARDHLARCRRCMAVYADSVRAVAEWRDEDAPGLQLVEKAQKAPPRPSRRFRYLIAACLPLVVAAGAWLALVGRDGPHPASELLAAASYPGMILPGAADPDWREPAAIRSGGTADVRRSDWETLRASGGASRLDAVTEIGSYLAQGNLDMARIRLEVEVAARPDDPGLLTLQGIHAYQESRLEAAETHLRGALENDPGDPVARFNLAFLLADRGEVGAARRIWEELGGESGHPFVSRRAAVELAGLAGR